MVKLGLLLKYNTIIAGILNSPVEDILFYRDNRLLKDQELYYGKTGEWGLGSYEVRIKRKIISTFRLYQLPHCCAIALSCNTVVCTGFKNKGIGTVLNSFRQELCSLLKYSTLMCTDIETNLHQRKILQKNGWKDIHSVINKRTANHVYISVIDI